MQGLRRMRGISRRDLLLAGYSQGALLTMSRADAEQVRFTANLGEPVRLLGKRMAFTGWQWIRPGGFAWVATGRPAGRLQEDVAPGEAELRTKDVARGLRLVTHPGERTGPLLQPEAPWEDGVGVTFTTLLKDQGMYRAWSLPTNTSGRPRGQRFFTYFESSDGYAWNRPKLRLFEYEGSRENNILNRSSHDYTKATPQTPVQFRKPELYSGSVFIDPAAKTGEKYKLIALGNIGKEAFERYLKRRPNDVDWRDSEDSEKEGAKSVRGAVSRDGIEWSILPDPVVIEPSDTHVVTYYDQNLGKYVLYTRKRNGPLRATTKPQPGTTDPLRRCIGRTESEDFLRFPVSEIALEIGPMHGPSDELYTNGRTSIPGGPDHHLMFPALWSNADDSTRFPLATSADGKRWQYLPGEPVFASSPYGHWDGGCVFLYPELTEMADGSWILPYAGYNVPHKYPRGQWRFAPGYAIWRSGRLVGLRADEQGSFTTIAILPPGRKLYLNAVTARAGFVKVEATSMNGKILPGRSFSESSAVVGDHRRAAIAWGQQTDLGHRDGEAVMLRFQLCQATLYWVDFE